jgi:hypothetical protein
MHQVVFSVHHVAHGVAREVHAQPFLGLGGVAAADHVDANEEVFVCIVHLSRADIFIGPVAAAARAGDEEDGEAVENLTWTTTILVVSFAIELNSASHR